MTDDPDDPGRARDDVGHGCFAIDAHGDLVGMSESIRDALIARGDLRCVDGIWYVSDINIFEDTPWLAACDFCAERPVVWNVRCEGFIQGDFESCGDLVACDTCGWHVQQDDRAGLLSRALASLVAIARGNPFDPAVLGATHDLFWQHYLGQVEPVPARPFGH